MRVCLLTHVFPAQPKDIPGTFVKELARNLARRGHVVHVVTPWVAGSPLEETCDGLVIHRFRHWGSFPTRLGALKRIPWGTFASFLFCWSRQAMRVVRTYDLEIIHAYWVAPAGLVGVVAGRLTKRPVVSTAAGTDIHTLPKRPLLRVVIRWTLKRLDGLIALGTAMRAKTTSLGMATERTQMILEDAGIDPAFRVPPRPPSASLRLLFVGRLVRPKRLDTLLAALPAVLARHPDTRLRIVGDGEERKTLAALARDLGVAGAMEFAGACAHDDLPRHFAESDLFVYPTENEGLPTAIAEAMMAGLAIVASPVGGIPDQIRDGREGLWAPFDDPAAWSRAILKLLADPAERQRLGENARAFAEREFSSNRITEKVEAVYKEALDRSSR